MTPAPSQPDLAARTAELRRGRLVRFAPPTLLWLAALPEWTDRLAATVGFPPSPDPTPLVDLLDRLEAAGLLTRRRNRDKRGEVVRAFWLPDSRRPDAGALLRETMSLDDMLEHLAPLAAALRALPEPARREFDPWLRVLDHHVRDVSGRDLWVDVDNLVAGERSTDALRLVGAAKPLADLLGEPLTASTRRAQWRVDRTYREARDLANLRHYLNRPDIDDVLFRLLTGDGSTWALHLLGAGGVGKTMTVRDLCSGRFAQRSRFGRPFPTARVDFDHLDPRYPEARPGELIAALLDELAAFNASREAESAYRKVDDALARLRESAPPTSELFDELVERFAGYLRALGGRVVLVLDTCEELAKLHPPGGRAPAVDRTFQALERIQRMAPEVRVVLAGRRWLVPPRWGGSGTEGLVLDPRPYLDVVPLGGFTREQADAYIELRDPQRTLAQPLRDALVDRSSQSSGPRGDLAVVSPFDLACYCDWALAEPDLDAARLLMADGDPYVEQRILARIDSADVRESLPVAVELGQFDRALLGPELRRRHIEVEAAFEGLIAQEWVSVVSFLDDGLPRVVAIDEQMRERLRSTFAAQPQRYPVNRERLGRDIAAQLAGRDLDDPAITALEAALRLLPLAEACTLWDRIEDRIATSEGGWAWATQATARVASAEALRAEGTGPTVLAAVLATQAAAFARQPGSPRGDLLWEKVSELASRHPDPAARARLRYRASCALGLARDPYYATEVVRVWREGGRDLDDSLVAMLEAMTAEEGAAPLHVDLVDALRELAASHQVQIAVTACLVQAADQLTNGRPDDAAAAIHQALAMAESRPLGRDGWRYWRPAARLRDRARLARLVVACVRGEEPDYAVLDRWRHEALDDLDDIDAERLVAATVMFESWWRAPDVELLHAIAGRETYTAGRQPVNAWHAAVPTLCTTLAAASPNGDFAAGAAGALRVRREEAVASGMDASTAIACERQLLVLSRTFREVGFTTSVQYTALSGDPASRLEAWATLTLLRGEAPPSPEEAGSWSTWLRTQVVRADAPLSRHHRPPPDALPIDVAEYDLCRGRRSSQDALRDGVLSDAWANFEGGLLPRSGGAANLGPLLRAAALCDALDTVAKFVLLRPARLVASTAVAEAELIALRRPDLAVGLLELGCSAARNAADDDLWGRAAALLVLTTARAGRPPRSVGKDDRAAVRRAGARAGANEEWRERFDLALTLLDNVPLRTRELGPSPEFDVREVVPEPVTDQPSLPPMAATPAPAPGSAPPRSRRLSTAVAAVGGLALALVAVIVFLLASTPSFLVGGRTSAVLVGLVVVAGAVAVGVAVGVVARRRTGGAGHFGERSVAVGGGGLIGCQLRATSSALIAEYKGTPGARPPSFAVLLGQRVGSFDRTEEMRYLSQVTEDPFFLRLKQSGLPVTWQLWDSPPVRGSVGTEFRGPAHLAPDGADDDPPDGVAAHQVRTLLHLVGTPVRTAAGWRIRVGTDASSGSGYTKSSRSLHVGEQLLGPDDLVVERTALVVLQADPVDGPSAHPLADAYDGMCGLAADLRYGGAGAVLVVPPLPDDVAAEAARAVYEAAQKRRHRLHPAHVLRLGETVREIVAGAELGRGDQDPRPSRDVLLFA